MQVVPLQRQLNVLCRPTRLHSHKRMWREPGWRRPDIGTPERVPSACGVCLCLPNHILGNALLHRRLPAWHHLPTSPLVAAMGGLQCPASARQPVASRSPLICFSAAARAHRCAPHCSADGGHQPTMSRLLSFSGCRGPEGECLPGVHLARYFSINYPDFSPRFTLSWRSPPSRPCCTAHLPYKAHCIIKQYL